MRSKTANLVDNIAAITPLQVRDWVRKNIPIIGIERTAAEVAKLSDKLDNVGLPNVTVSSLVTMEMTKHLTTPKGWDKDHAEQWRRLPFHLAKWVTEKRDADIRAVRRAQNNQRKSDAA